MRITVKEASKILEVSESTLRRGMRTGELPIGSVITNENGYTYLIYKEKIDAYLNIDNNAINVINKTIDYLNEIKKGLL